MRSPNGIFLMRRRAVLDIDAAVEVRLGFLSHFDQKMCLASNPRLVRIRPILERVGIAFAQLCRF